MRQILRLLAIAAGVLPNLILVVNPAVQYMAYEWLIQRHTTYKQRQLLKAGTLAAGKRAKLSAGEVFVLGELAVIG